MVLSVCQCVQGTFSPVSLQNPSFPCPIEDDAGSGAGQQGRVACASERRHHVFGYFVFGHEVKSPEGSSQYLYGLRRESIFVVLPLMRARHQVSNEAEIARNDTRGIATDSIAGPLARRPCSTLSSKSGWRRKGCMPSLQRPCASECISALFDTCFASAPGSA
jgi:hypothetical protein